MLTLGPVSRAEHEAFLIGRPASFVQSPGWADVRENWRTEALAWRDPAGEVVGVVLVMLRDLPFVGRSLGCIAEGPVLDHYQWRPEQWVDPLREYYAGRGAVLLRLGVDLVARSWEAGTVKAAVGPGRDVRAVTPDATSPVAAALAEHLQRTGWVSAAGVPDDVLPGLPQHRFVVPLDVPSQDALLGRMNQQFRRGIRKAEAAGVQIVRGGADRIADFHAVYTETARRDGFPPHELEHFERLWRALDADPATDIRLYLAELEGEVLAGMLVVVNGGVAGYAYGGSVTHRREAFPSNAAHWRILCDLLAEGATTYDMRGVDSTLDPDAHRFGVLRFKLGTGGRLEEHLGDWDLVISRRWARGIRAAVRLRAGLLGVRAVLASRLTRSD